MKIINNLKLFWKQEKYYYLLSCLSLFLIGSFVGLVKKLDMQATLLFILIGLPVMFIFAFVIYEFTGGDK